MKQTPKFFVQVPCKPYVKQFIEDIYGYPPDFTTDKYVQRIFNRLLKEPSHHRDCNYPQPSTSYSEIGEIMISEEDFFRYGFELSKTDIINFGRFFEGRCKTIMRTYIGVLRSLGLPFNKSIRRFQKRFGFTEDIWTYQVIKKSALNGSNPAQNTMLAYSERIK